MAFRSARSLADFGRRRTSRDPRKRGPRSDSPPPRAERVWTPPPGTFWGPFAQLTPRLRMQASSGFRAAAVPLGPGLFLVAEVPEESAAPEFGVAPLLAPLMVMAAQRALNPKPRPAPAQTWPPAQQVPSTTMPVPASAAPSTPPGWMEQLATTVQRVASPAAQLGWAHPDDLVRLGCGGDPTCWRHR